MSEPIVPGMVPGFELGEAIGKGGFATVYRARQVSLNRDVAIKIDSRVLDDDRNRRRFLREATASALISSHPHVVSLIDAGTTRDNRPYLVMELCSNGSVARLVKRDGPMPPADALELGIAIASALAAAHQLGILHRDIKPSNILIDPFNTPRLGDFGLAALPAQGEASVTLEALTPAYAAPEAFEQAAPSKRADVWSLGATLYSVLTGEPPRRNDDGSAQNVAEIIQSLYRQLPRIPNIPEPLMGVIWRATAPQAGQRYADGGALHAALLALRGRLGSPHQVLAGSDVTRVLPTAPATPPGPPPVPFPAPAAPVGPASAGPAALNEPTRARRAWPVVLSVGLAAALGVGGFALGRGLLPNQDASSVGQAPSPSRTPSAAVEPSPTPTPGESQEGEPGPGLVVPASPVCFAGLVSVAGYYSAQQVDCDSEHHWEAYLVGSLSDDTASASIADVEKDPAVKAACTIENLAAYTDLPVDELESRVLPPTREAFDGGSRLFYCVAAAADGPTTGSFRSP